MKLKITVCAALLWCLPVGAYAAMTPDGKMIPVPEYDQAELLVLKGEFEPAMPLLLDVLRRYPTHASAWNLLGYMARKDGDLEKAAGYYERALKVNPAHLGALNYQGHLFMETGQPEKAKANLDLLAKACNSACPEFIQLKKLIETGVSDKYSNTSGSQ